MDSPREGRALVSRFSVPLSEVHISEKFQKPHCSLKRPSPLSTPRRPSPSRSHCLSSELSLTAAQGCSWASQDPPPSACFKRAPSKMSHVVLVLTEAHSLARLLCPSWAPHPSWPCPPVSLNFSVCLGDSAAPQPAPRKLPACGCHPHPSSPALSSCHSPAFSGCFALSTPSKSF